MTLTVAGRAHFALLRGAVTAFDERLRAGFTDEELATLRELVQRLAADAPAPTPQPSGHNRKETR